jgi:hypothetical protein
VVHLQGVNHGIIFKSIVFVREYLDSLEHVKIELANLLADKYTIISTFKIAPY